MKVALLKRRPSETLRINGKTYYYQFATPHMSNVESWVKENRGLFFIKVFKWQRPGWANKKKGLKYRPDYYIYIRRKVTKKTPSWYFLRGHRK